MASSATHPPLPWMVLVLLVQAAVGPRAIGAIPASPYGGIPWPVPGTIEVEHYDLGGEGVAFHWSGLVPVWPGSDIRIAGPPGREPDSPSLVPQSPFFEEPTNHIALRAGEWLQFSVHCSEAAFYSVHLSAAEPPILWADLPSDGLEQVPLPGEAVLHLELDGKDVTGPVTGLPKTVCPRIWIPAGDHRIRMIADRVKPEGGFRFLVEDPPGFLQEAAPGTVLDRVRRAADGTFFAMIAPAGLPRLEPAPGAFWLRVLSEGSGRVVGGPFLAEVGETIRLEALGTSEWIHFEGWSDGSTDNPRTLQLDRDLYSGSPICPGRASRVRRHPGIH